MNGYNLKEEQKELLRELVRLVNAHQLQEPIFPIPGFGVSKRPILEFQLKHRRRFEWPGDIDDLDALCDENLMTSRWNTSGTGKLYNIRQAGYEAVNNDFQVPPSLVSPQITIGNIIGEMSGGSILGVGFAEGTTISQIVNDPTKLQTAVDCLVERLIDEVKPELTANDLMAYIQAAQNLKEQLLAEEPKPSLVRQLFGKLAFLADLEGTWSLMVRIWPLLIQLLLLVAAE